MDRAYGGMLIDSAGQETLKCLEKKPLKVKLFALKKPWEAQNLESSETAEDKSEARGCERAWLKVCIVSDSPFSFSLSKAKTKQSISGKFQAAEV